ncbi:UNVERIFIED_CONTAM: hypothetical protein PYX00_003126 [Menopon gallinae]|uniref:NADH dehydrogenase [ubiquinone] 1 alpha subcomplex subunit 12 n=1 Tax=Menopon gallinae TaxID=328185 RepID=A0AAW2HZZ5_9NEOP
MEKGISRFIATLKYFGGGRGYLLQRLRTDDSKMGKFMGEDVHGNKYYESNYYFFGRNRWVQYSDKFGYDYDSSHIPAEWFGWLHYKTDLVPHEDPNRPAYKWMAKENINHTGTANQYVPYTTTKSKVEAWVPKRKS